MYLFEHFIELAIIYLYKTIDYDKFSRNIRYTKHDKLVKTQYFYLFLLEIIWCEIDPHRYMSV